jgi:hypothetical protein
VQKVLVAELRVVIWMLEVAEYFVIIVLASLPFVAVLGTLIFIVMPNASQQEDRRHAEDQRRYDERSGTEYAAFEDERQEKHALQEEFGAYSHKCGRLLWDAYGPPEREYEFFVWFSKHFPDAKQWKEKCTIPPSVMVGRFVQHEDPALPEEPGEDGAAGIKLESDPQPNPLAGPPGVDPIKRQEEKLRKLLTPEP